MLETRGQPYVLAIRSNHSLRLLTAEGLLQTDPAELAASLPPEDWHAHAAGEGAKGLRLSDWASIALPWTTAPGFRRWLLVRRSRANPRANPKALAYYVVFAPETAGLAELAADLRRAGDVSAEKKPNETSPTSAWAA